MKYFSFLLILCQIIFHHPLLAGESESLDQYYQQMFTGQHLAGNYDGPLNPLTRFNNEMGQLVFLDEDFKNNYFHAEIQSDFFELRDFWFNKLNDKSACPDSELGQNLDYIRYLYRLITISYLFESLRINHRINTQLGGDKNLCSLSYDEIFGKCNPQTSDMKKFKERVQGKFANEISLINYSPLFKSEINGWLTLFKRSSIDAVDPTFSRLYSWCKMTGKNCRDLTLPKIKEAVAGFCERDRELMQKICDEKDELYGLSYIEKSADIVKISSAFNLVNSSGSGEQCLRRFTKVFKAKESRSHELAQIYPAIYHYLVNEKSRFLQGELFLPGALKEFDKKGLNDFLAALKPPKPVVAVVVPPPKPIDPPQKIVIEKPKPQVLEVKNVQEEVISLPIPEVKISEFERAVLELKEKNLARVSLDMDLFQSDMEFTTKQISELAPTVRKFQARKALKEMKQFDRLGSKEGALGLVFIKFLIDTENHQGLYNVLAELGNNFYVMNNLENKKDPILVELRNDVSTHNKWQLSIIKPQKNSEALLKKNKVESEEKIIESE